MENQATTTETPVMHAFTSETSKGSSSMKTFLLFIVIVVLGVGTGFILSLVLPKTGNHTLPFLNGSSMKGKTFGSTDMSTFKDVAEGTLKEGGIEGEGQYHLVRTGGESQNVYVTSSLVDLSQFVDKKIKVWGETQAAQKAGWLMDVGKVEIL